MGLFKNNVVNINGVGGSGGGVVYGNGIQSIIQPDQPYTPELAPHSLRDYDNWVIWALVDTGKTNDRGQAEIEKLPLYVATNTKGVYIGRAQWKNDDRRMSWDVAYGLFEKWRHLGIGLGYIFCKDDPFMFIDLDKIEMEKKGYVGLDIIQRAEERSGCRLWCETSVSGRGLHYFVECGLGDRRNGVNGGGIELYSHGRFCAITGWTDWVSDDVGADMLFGDGWIDEMVSELYERALDGENRTDGLGRERECYGAGEWDGIEYKLPSVVGEGSRDNTLFEYCQSLWYKYGDAERGLELAIADALDVVERLWDPVLSEDEVSKKVLRRWNIEKERGEVREEEVRDDLLWRYVFIVSENKWYDVVGGVCMVSKALDIVWAWKYKGIKGSPSASTMLWRSEDMMKADMVSWYPSVWVSGSDEDRRIRREDLLIRRQGTTYCNQWRGFGIEPAEIGLDVDNGMAVYFELLEHLFGSEGGSDGRGYIDNVLDWMAFNVQYPDVKINWQLVIVGVKGAGKNLLFRPFMDIWGSAGKCVSPKELETAYDDGFCFTKVCLFSEVKGISGKHMENIKTKAASESGEFVEINPKSRAKVMMPNLWSLIMLANDYDCLKITSDERRFYVLGCDRVLDVSSVDSLGQRYIRWLENGGAGLLFRFLLDRDLMGSGFNRGKCEKTHWFYECFDASRDDLESGLEEAVSSGLYGDLVLPEYIVMDMKMRSIPCTEREVKNELNKLGYRKYPNGVGGTVDFRIAKSGQKSKSRAWMYKTDSVWDLNKHKVKCIDVWEACERIERMYINGNKKM